MIIDEQFFKQALESTCIGILVVGSDSNVLYYNHHFVKMWRYPEELLLSGDDEKLLSYSKEQLAKPEDFIEKVKHLYTSNKDSSDALIFRDGRVFQRFSKAMQVNGTITGRIWSFIDVTEYKDAKVDSLLSKENYYLLFESTSDLVVIHQEGIIKYVNNRLTDMSQYTPKDILGKSVFDFVHENEKRKIKGYFESRVLGKDVPQVYETVLLDKDGRNIDVEITASRIYHEGVLSVLSFIRDIAKRKAALRNLKESEERFRALSEKTSDWIWEVDESGKYSYSSPKVKELFNQSPTDFVGKSFFFFMHPEEAKRNMELFNGKMNEAKPFEHVINSFVNTSGERRWIESSGVPFFDTNGKLRGYRGINRDITQRKLIEEEIIAQRDLSVALSAKTDLNEALKLCLDTACRISNMETGAIYSVDEDGSMVMRRQVGLPEDIIQQLVSLPSQSREYITALGGKPVYSAYRDMPRSFNSVIAPRGYRCFAIIPVKHDGKIIASIHMATKRFDQVPETSQFALEEIAARVGGVIARIEAEQQSKEHQKQLFQASKLASLGTLVSGIAHEINNPNHFIMSNSAIMLDSWQDALKILDKYNEENGDFPIGGMPYTEFRESFPKMISNIVKGSHKIKNIVQELKDYSKTNPINMAESVDINAVINSSLVLVANIIRQSTSNLVVTLQKSIPPIQGNYQRLEQVMINLLSNACEALDSKADGVYISSEFNKKDNVIRVNVKDDGIGISEEVMDQISDPFFTTKRRGGGTGLGLSISTKIISEHNGTLDFESVEGKGTNVTVSLPVARV